MIASVAGTLEGGRISRERPFRAPHHSASMAAMTGGGLRVRPGEVSLAHLGVLFLDELPEFQRAVLDSLRQPVESGEVSVARANAHVTYPARVQLIAAMNPCRCGHLGDPALACSRAPKCAGDYQTRVSGPLLDRIDLHVEVEPVPPPRYGERRARRDVGAGGGKGGGGAGHPDGAPSGNQNALQRRAGRRRAGNLCHARRGRPRTAAARRRSDEAVGARIHTDAASGAEHRRSGRRRQRWPRAYRRGPVIPPTGTKGLEGLVFAAHLRKRLGDAWDDEMPVLAA